MGECKFCSLKLDNEWVIDEKFPYTKSRDIYIGGHISGSHLVLVGNVDEVQLPVAVKKINYCPMCGRKLSERNED